MLNMKKLSEIKDQINLKRVCEDAGLVYNSIAQKLWRYEKGKKVELYTNEARLLTEQIKQLYHITMED